jgi:hypothetical protein
MPVIIMSRKRFGYNYLMLSGLVASPIAGDGSIEIEKRA